MQAASELLRNLRDRQEIYSTESGTIVSATHTVKFSPNDFAVGLVSPERTEFFPTHVRLLIDLYLKRVSNREDSNILFCAIEGVYNGEDPTTYASALRSLNFPMQLDDAEVNLYYVQLLMVEQDFNVKENSRVFPGRLFLMRFIRWVYSGNDQIDKIITCAVRNWPASPRYNEPIDCTAMSYKLI